MWGRGGGEGGGGVSPLPPRGHHSPLSRRWLPAMPPYYNKQFRCTKKAMEIIEKRECRLERIRKEKYLIFGWTFELYIFYVAMWCHGSEAGLASRNNWAGGQMNISIAGTQGPGTARPADGSHRHSYFSARIFQIITQAFIKWHTVCAPGSEFIFLM